MEFKDLFSIVTKFLGILAIVSGIVAIWFMLARYVKDEVIKYLISEKKLNKIHHAQHHR